MFSDIVKASSKSAKRKRRAAAKKKSGKGDKAPSGFSPIPNSKKGGYRKKQGGRWVYWYPGQGQVSSAKKEDIDMVAFAEKAPEIAAAAAGPLAEMSKQLAKIGRMSKEKAFVAMIKLGNFYKKKHHEIDEGVHAAKVASDFNIDPAGALDMLQSLSQMVMAIESVDDNEEQ